MLQFCLLSRYRLSNCIPKINVVSSIAHYRVNYCVSALLKFLHKLNANCVTCFLFIL